MAIVTKTLTPLKAIRKKCYECSAYQITELRECPVERCPLWVYRSGHLPKEMPTYEVEVRNLTDEEKAASAERLRRMREAKNAAKVMPAPESVEFEEDDDPDSEVFGEEPAEESAG